MGFPFGRLARRCGRVSGRDDMLGRIRRALRRPPSASPTGPGSQTQFPKLEDVIAPITHDGRVPRFEEEFANVAGSPHRASTTAELENILRAIFEDPQVTSAVLTRNPLLAQLGLPAKLHAWGKSVAQWPDAPTGVAQSAEEEKIYRDQCFSAGVGITGVDFVLAETGS